MEKNMNKTNMIIAAIVGLVVVGGGAFYAGLSYAKSQSNRAGTARSAAFNGQFGGATGAGARGGIAGRAGAFGAGGVAMGEVIAKDDNSITVKMRDGGSKIIFYSGTTQVMKAVSGSAADVAVGQAVTAMGKTNTDGSVSAESIQIRPAMPATNPSTMQPGVTSTAPEAGAVMVK